MATHPDRQAPRMAELPITGYFDRLSARPGEALAAYVSVRDGGDYRARLERLICGDPNPAGPGRRVEDLSGRYDRTFIGRRQKVALGSYARIDAMPPATGARLWTALICPGVIDREQAVIAQHDGDRAIVLLITADGVQARLTWPGESVTLRVTVPLRARRWYRVWLAADPATGAITLGHAALESGVVMSRHAALAGGVVMSRHAALAGGGVTEAVVQGGVALPVAGTLLIAADDAAVPGRHFTGKIEAPTVRAGATDDAPILAAWDFARDIGGTGIVDIGPHGCHGRLVNLPARAMVGAGWSGAEHCWRHAPGDYAAIHFHADDLEDCLWETDFAFVVPDDLRSGCYLLHLTCAEGEDWLPFYVLAPRQGPRAPIAFLASTLTYIAYANHARGNCDAALRARMAAWGAYPHNADDYPIYGRSTYNRHDDNSGISLSSRRRPILTMRPGYLTFNDAAGSGLRHFVADTHLLAWLEDKGFAYDVVTDEDLDDEGHDLLTPYRIVLTGSHPEYHTARMLDAISAYIAGGGRLAYLGGNGFYWRIARSPALPHVMEIRRAEGGIRAWPAEPGEYYHQLDGQLGGMWRRGRRPPQQLVGVGFSGQGLFEGTYYRRLPASRAPEHAWLFAGIEEDIIGDYGLSGGGAAGFEFDRADPDLGTPDNAVILARSENPPASVTTVLEELLSHLGTVNGETPAALMRAEIVVFETPGGGMVFATGSITFCGSLWRDGFTGPVSRLLENVVRRFGGDMS
jgi:N,N-dimethylformamidase